ncbi:MAG: efflux RND transporter periplasmic adaptor subunit [Treponema sp.]|nr:efflux RND transporter periplasmic adaptor subunit [Treponema sp.]
MKPVFWPVILTVMLTVMPALFSSCAGAAKDAAEKPRALRGKAAAFRELSGTAEGFGSLSFLTKVDILAPQEGTVKRLYYREGDTVTEGGTVVLLANPQIGLAVGRAENACAQAEAARNLARSRLLEGEFQAEARVLGIKKAEAELAQARRVWEEDRRKHEDQEVLFGAGGLSEEVLREGRFALEMEGEKIALMERELAIQRIGSRPQDLETAGIPVPSDGEELARAVVSLMTVTLRAELEAAGAGLLAAEKELDSARLAESELRVRSPGKGLVGARYFEEGERVKREDKLFTLMDLSSLYAIFPLRENEALRLEKGMAAEVLVDGTGGTYRGTVDLVYPQADSQSFSFLVRVLLDGAPEDLRPGMFARVSVDFGQNREALVIPESALVNKKNEEAKVFVFNGNTLSERQVILGASLGGEREIVSGIKAGEVVVLRPDWDLREGLYVSLAE